MPAIGVSGCCWIEGWSLLDAHYMTITALATVGYGETHPLQTSGRALTMGLIISGGMLEAFAPGQFA